MYRRHSNVPHNIAVVYGIIHSRVQRTWLTARWRDFSVRPFRHSWFFFTQNHLLCPISGGKHSTASVGTVHVYTSARRHFCSYLERFEPLPAFSCTKRPIALSHSKTMHLVETKVNYFIYCAL